MAILIILILIRQYRRYCILVSSLTFVRIGTAARDVTTIQMGGQQVDQEEINKYQQVQVWFGIVII